MIHVADPAASERAKYHEIWSDVPDYRAHSPGLENVERFLDVMRPAPSETLLDAGCGSGIAGLKLAEHGLNVTWLDITDAGLETDVPRDRFIEAPLWSRWHRPMQMPRRFDYGFCCDVMEHIPPEYTMLVASRIIESCATAWFQIAFLPDSFGTTIGQDLHLTVQPYSWWLERLASLGTVIDARDLCGMGLFVVGRDR